MQKIALIPAYCPEDRMIWLIKELDTRGFAVVVIDDGSGEEYDELFTAARHYASVKRYTPNRGKGEALKCGMRYIKERYQAPYTVITADADGQHRVEDIVKVADAAAEHPDSLILGKRLLDKSAPIKSRIGNGITRVLYRLTTGRRIYETQTGLRAFSDRLLPRFLKLPGHRYEFEIDMILDASNADIIEVDIQTVYFDNNAASHFRPLQDTVSLNKEFLRYKLPSINAGLAGLLLFVLFVNFGGAWIWACVLSRLFTILLKGGLNRVVPFAEKPSVGRYILTSGIILLCDIGVMAALVSVGVNVYAAKVLSGIVMVFVSMIVRTVFMRVKFG
ncbi:glycosyltransferase family 2 protein [Ruminococcus sp.]|uniref:glycosyltransferase family 2 protein n=1 Tax=Ruminococcus sp. TaxID=41978 RepID=UPI002E810A3B|nr:glycosyltransferase family 2 protein [Ruminococcus sp.]MEE3492387.1 glycosyltransferase family 2 protein [Ruminococcus sp.]